MKRVIAAFGTMLMMAGCLLTSSASAMEAEQTKSKRGNIFESDSDFIKGFETGVLMRTKQGDIADYGCALTEDESDAKKVFDSIVGSMLNLKAFLGDDQVLIDAFAMVEEYIKSLQFYIQVFTASEDSLDMYCRGMIFGLEGSKMLVKIANVINQPATEVEPSADGKPRKKRSKGGVFDIWKAASKKFTELGEKFIEGLDPNKGEDL